VFPNVSSVSVEKDVVEKYGLPGLLGLDQAEIVHRPE
jgi:hypothetical protein